ncbi:MAG: hypothetical protein HS126_23370 [Anaerolineales bacterium]|nr:hypothetical protein [Anaerolineales bacterium]
MNLAKRVVAQLEQLATKGPQHIDAVILNSPQQGYIVGVPAADQEPGATITLEAYDRYSVTLRQLEVSYGPSSPDEGYLRRSAERAASRLTYLEEPLLLLELDPAEKLAQLRSNPPHQEDEALIYWELLTWAEPQLRVRLARYRWQPGQGREQISYPATFATLGRLAQDLALSIIEE